MEIPRRPAVILAAVLYLALIHYPAQAFEIRGSIRAEGDLPEKVIIPVSPKHQACGPEQVSQSLVISVEGGVQNAVISIRGVGTQGDGTGDGTEGPFLNQTGCHFVPHILLVPQNQVFRIGNEDRMAHDVRAFEGAKMLFRFEMEALASPIEEKFERPGKYILRCGLHPWMHGYVVSMEHPYYGVSDESGDFEIKNVPPGNYTLNIWHETLGEADLPVEVSRSITDFSYTFSMKAQKP